MSDKIGKAQCAALAFHKALIGLSQLDALERASGTSSSFYGARGIYTYYSVYHLFCACMLIVPEQYSTVVLKRPKDYGCIKDADLNNPSESPEQWEKGREYEADWATSITHGQIKKFCKGIRQMSQAQWEQDVPYLIPLYNSFIDDTDAEQQCIPGMYEKLCYVRDRVIYRPSFVLMDTGGVAQTSAQMGEELRSLPQAKTLYQAISDVYHGLIIGMERERDHDEYGVLTSMFFELWTGRVKEDVNDLCALGHKRRRLQRLGEKEGANEYSFPTYVSHLLELEDIDFIRRYRKKYWSPLERMYMDSRFAWRNHNKAKAGSTDHVLTTV